jgi:hypothetical protein
MQPPRQERRDCEAWRSAHERENREVTEQEHRLIERAAKAEGARLSLRLPVATYIRRAAVLAAQAATAA